MDDAEARLQAMLDRFDPAVAALARAARAKFRRRLPTAWEIVYDNYSGCAVGYSANDKGSGAIVSMVVYPRYVRMFFLRGASLPDPTGRLEGKGSQVRSIVLTTPEVFDEPAVQDLIAEAVKACRWPLPQTSGRLLIKSVTSKQIPRRPGQEIH